MLLAASRSLFCTAATRETDRGGRIWEEKSRIKMGFGFCIKSVSGAVSKWERDELAVLITKNVILMKPRVHCWKHHPLGRFPPSARADLLWSTPVWLQQSSSSGLRSRWILCQFQVFRRRGRNGEVRFCKRQTEKFSIGKCGETGKSETLKIVRSESNRNKTPIKT